MEVKNTVGCENKTEITPKHISHIETFSKRLPPLIYDSKII